MGREVSIFCGLWHKIWHLDLNIFVPIFLLICRGEGEEEDSIPKATEADSKVVPTIIAILSCPSERVCIWDFVFAVCSAFHPIMRFIHLCYSKVPNRHILKYFVLQAVCMLQEYDPKIETTYAALPKNIWDIIGDTSNCDVAFDKESPPPEALKIPQAKLKTNGKVDNNNDSSLMESSEEEEEVEGWRSWRAVTMNSSLKLRMFLKMVMT